MGSRFLDLCAGSGSVGIEALSRGAEKSVFIDNHPTAISLIRRNLEALGLGDRAVVLQRDALKGLADLERRRELFDEVFLDPPYDSDTILRCLPSPRWPAIMRGRGRIFVEHRRDLSWPHLAEWERVDSRRFGETMLSVFRRTEGS
jgi:16S rRNA (guanine(966)-N(2))-methyltransferase RsmD